MSHRNKFHCKFSCLSRAKRIVKMG